MRRRRDKKKSRIINIVLCILGVLFLVVAFVVGSIFIEYNSVGEGTKETVTIEIEGDDEKEALEGIKKAIDSIADDQNDEL